MTRNGNAAAPNEILTVLQECEMIAASASCAAVLARIYGMLKLQEHVFHSLAEEILSLQSCVAEHHRPAPEP